MVHLHSLPCIDVAAGNQPEIHELTPSTAIPCYPLPLSPSSISHVPFSFPLPQAASVHAPSPPSPPSSAGDHRTYFHDSSIAFIDSSLSSIPSNWSTASATTVTSFLISIFTTRGLLSAASPAPEMEDEGRSTTLSSPDPRSPRHRPRQTFPLQHRLVIASREEAEDDLTYALTAHTRDVRSQRSEDFPAYSLASSPGLLPHASPIPQGNTE